MHTFHGRQFVAMFENDNDALIPELWAQESLAILEESMVMGNLVHRDFEDEFAKFGEIVNTRKPRDFKGKRKIDSEDVTVQDAISDNIAVPLDQHWHVSFTIKDGEETKSFKDLVQFYLRPQVVAIARAIDRVTSGRVMQFALKHRAGLLGTAATNETVLDVRNVMNKNFAYQGGRRLVLTSDTETELLKLDVYSEADKLGDGGAALREAVLGRKHGFDIFMAQNMLSSANNSNIASTTINGAVIIGASSVVVAANTGMSQGNWMSIAGRPYLITNIASTTISVYPTVDRAIANGAAVTTYQEDTVNQTSVALANGGDGSTAGYRAGWHKDIIVDGNTITPEIGAAVTFGTSAGANTPIYTVIDNDATANTIYLDRPLDAAVADGAAVNRGPIGNYNFAFHRNAVALVTRPLQSPREGTGALARTATFNGLGIRSCITYEGRGQGHLVTADLLMGIATLDSKLGAVMLA